MIKEEVSWSTFKQEVSARNLRVQYFLDNNNYKIYAFDGQLVLFCEIYKEATAAAGSDQEDFETNYMPNANKPVYETTPVQQIPKVSIYKPEGSSTTKVSHDWTDPCTWYSQSVRVTGETLSLVSGKTYSFANQNIIDLTHGRLYQEDVFASSYLLKVYDNGVLKSEGVDYNVDYPLGQLTFDANYTVTGPVTADYSYENGSQWVLAPDPGKVLHIEHSEVQFSRNVSMSPISFEIWVYNPFDPPNKIKYQEIVYKNIKDIINSANLGQGFIPAIDMLSQDILVFPFNYSTVKSLKSSDGAELRIRILNDTAYSGEYATATFYVLSQDE